MTLTPMNSGFCKTIEKIANVKLLKRLAKRLQKREEQKNRSTFKCYIYLQKVKGAW